MLKYPIKTIELAKDEFNKNKPSLPEENALEEEVKKYHEKLKPHLEKRKKIIEIAIRQMEESFGSMIFIIMNRLLHLYSRCKALYDRSTKG